MKEHLYPTLFALFVWWFSTGAIIYLDGLPRRTFKWSMAGASVVLLVCLFGLRETADDASVKGAYLAFTFGLLAWGWQELSFYTGYVTGPRKTACDTGCRGLRHFWHGIQVTLWHELAIIAAFAVIVWLTWGGANQIGLWTFAVLWWMHESAKLNVFLGVRNLSLEFIPDHLAYLKRYLRKRPMNLLFPVSVTISTIVCFLLFDRAFAAEASAFEAVGYTFLGVLMALAILEHWFLILPLPFAKLWHWSLASRVKDPGPPQKRSGPEAFSAVLPQPVEAVPLAQLLDTIDNGTFGRIDRVKGIARSDNGWLRFDAGGGKSRISTFTAREGDQPQFTAIGHAIDRDGLTTAFGLCRVRSVA